LVKMLSIDRRHDRDHRREHQKAAIAFIRLDHKIFAAAHSRGRPPPDSLCRRPQTSDRDAPPQESTRPMEVVGGFPRAPPPTAIPYFRRINSRQHLRPRNHGESFRFVRFHNFRIVGFHPRKKSPPQCAPSTFAAWCPSKIVAAQILQPLGDRRRLQVGAGKPNIPVSAAPRRCRSLPMAADAYQVDALKIAKTIPSLPRTFPFAAPPRPLLSIKFTMSRRRLRIGKASAHLWEKRFNLPGLVEEGENLAPPKRFSGKFPFSVISRPACGIRPSPAALRNWWLSVARPKRDEDRRSARRGYLRGSDRSSPAKPAGRPRRSVPPCSSEKETTSAKISRRAYAVLTAL